MFKKKSSYQYKPEQKKSTFKETKPNLKVVNLKESVASWADKKEEPEQIECLCCKNNCSCCDHQSGTGPIHTCKCRCHAADVVQ